MSFDRSFWQAVVEGGFALPAGYSAGMLLPHLAELLASPDPYLRETVAAGALVQWVVRRPEETSDAECRALRDTLLEERLFDGIGEQGTNSVFRRSFAALALSMLVYRDNERPYLGAAEISALHDAALNLLRREADRRGYVEDRGWASVLTHTADLLKFLARSPHTGPQMHRAAIEAIFDAMTAPLPPVLTHDEDERLAAAVVAILQRDLIDTASWLGWVQQFVDWRVRTSEATGTFEAKSHAAYHNVKRFLRSLYFQVEGNESIPAAGVVFRAGVLAAARQFSAYT